MYTKKARLPILIIIMTLCTGLLSGCDDTPQEPLVFGVIMGSALDDHGWSEAHYEAGTYVEENLENAQMLTFDKLNAADNPNLRVEQVVDTMVTQGAQLIFTVSDDFQDDTDQVAEKYSNVTFINISGDHALDDGSPQNLGNYMGKMEFTTAIAGCHAALATETGHIGYVGPLINNETRRLVNASYLGARYCYEHYRGLDPDTLNFTVAWIGFWFHLPGVTLDPTEVSQNFIDSGVDVLMSGIDTTESIVVAGQRAEQGARVYAIPYDYRNACDLAPEICLGVPYFNWGPGYLEIAEKVQDDVWKKHWTWAEPDWTDINNLETSAAGYLFGPGTSDAWKTDVETYITHLSENHWNGLFVGPLNWQDGTPWLAEGDVATERAIWNTPQLLEGIEVVSQ